MPSLLTFLTATTALVTGTHARQFHNLFSAGRGLSNTEEYPCDPEGLRTWAAPGNGCTYLPNGCAECGTKHCVANIETNALWEFFQDNGNDAEGGADMTSMCSAITSLVHGFDEENEVWPACATDEELDTATEAQWTELETTSVHTGVILESWTAEAGKAFMAANCVNAPTGYYYGCVSKLRQAVAEAEMMESCAGLQGDGETPFCHSWPMLMNETCAIKLGSSLLGVQEAVMEAIYLTAAELHTECQKLETATDCHSFDGSAWTKILNETVTVDGAAAVLATATTDAATHSHAGHVVSIIGAITLGMLMLM